MTIAWRYGTFGELSARDVYEVLRLRNLVFVVEQNAPYQDVDALDYQAHHLLGEREGALIAYLRVLPPGIHFPAFTIGRVVVDPSARGKGAGRALMAEGIRRLFATHGGPIPTALKAQQRLERFYTSFGYTRTPSEPFLEDDIWHVEMVREAVPA